MLKTIESKSPSAHDLMSNIEKVVKGKRDSVELSIITLLARGHLLIEDVPGVGKTTLAYSLAKSVHCDFKRIQFTSDLLPSDILGVSIYDTHRQEFHFNKGPIFTNIALADEINRTTPKTQSSLLEVMERGKVSIDSSTYDLPQPFMVIATQNPVDYEGTFPLPRSQMDRFLMRIEMGYPDQSHELDILKYNRRNYSEIPIDPIATPEQIMEMQAKVEEVHISDEIYDYVLKLIHFTRSGEFFEMGVSPRGGLALCHAAQSCAYVSGRDFVTPDDIKRLIKPVFSHRVVLKNRRSSDDPHLRETNELLDRILSSVPPPP
ncbi:MAG: MoxR family ATPase [Verrucomicrobiota bacterium]|nr:MoxR family ATPase [Verrucomicrobiota bacterium]